MCVIYNILIVVELSFFFLFFFLCYRFVWWVKIKITTTCQSSAELQVRVACWFALWMPGRVLRACASGHQQVPEPIRTITGRRRRIIGRIFAVAWRERIATSLELNITRQRPHLFGGRRTTTCFGDIYARVTWQCRTPRQGRNYTGEKRKLCLQAEMEPVSDPVFDPVLSFNMRVYRSVVSTE